MAVAADTEALVDQHSTDAQADLLFRTAARQSTSLLFWGTTLAMLGFVVALVVSPGEAFIPGDAKRQVNMFGLPFPSGKSFVPASISAMIHDTSSAVGVIFKCCVMPGAMMILVSKYPYYLNNVYVGNAKAFPCCKCWPLSLDSMLALRSFAIPMGLIVVCLAPIAYPNYTNFGWKVVLYAFHTTGALFPVAVWLLSEYLILSSPDFKLAPGEKIARQLCWGGMLVSILFFISTYMLPLLPICCDDQYLPVNNTVISTAASNMAYYQEMEDKELQQLSLEHPEAKDDPILYKGLYDTSTGLVRVITIVGWWGEMACLLFALLGHWVVWYFCKERHILLPEVLPTP